MVAQVRNVLEEQDFLCQCDVVEQDKVLVQLTHISNMRHDRKREFLRKKADGEKFTHSRQSCAVRLNLVQGP